MWGFEGNILSLMLKRVYEDPINTAQDILDRGLIILLNPGFAGESWQRFLSFSDDESYRKLANKTFIPKDALEYWHTLFYHVQNNGTHVLLDNQISWLMKKTGQYHISEDEIGGILPYMGWITNKMFHLNEDLAIHFLIYQQACLLVQI